MPKRLFVLTLALVFLTLSCQKGDHKAKEELPTQTVKAKLYQVRPYPVAEYREFVGQVCPKEKITLAARIPGYVRQVLVDEGDTVSPGEVLLRLDDRELKADIEALLAEARALEKEREALISRLDYAKANFKRFEALFKEKAATKDEYEQARAQYLSLAAQKEALLAKQAAIKAKITKVKNLLSYTEIKAPLRAKVVKRLVSQGTMATPGTPLLVLEGLSSFRFCVSLDEGLLNQVDPRGKYLVSFPALKKTLTLSVLAVVPRVDPKAKTFLLKLKLPEGNFVSGLLGRLYFPVGTKEKLLIPKEAIFYRGDLAGVYLVDEKGIAHFQVLRLGDAYVKEGPQFKPAFPEAQTLYFEVLSGLKSGARIVLEPEKVKDGTKVI